MKNAEILKEIKKYFDISELVGNVTHLVYKERAWRFLDINMLHCLLIVRKGLDAKIKVNYSNIQQRGLRTNVQPIVKNKTLLYISAHIQGKAVDFDVDGMSAEYVRHWIVENGDLFPCKIRLESNVNWVHLDVIWEEKNPKVYQFNV